MRRFDKLLPSALRVLPDRAAFARWFQPRLVRQTLRSMAVAASGGDAGSESAQQPLLLQRECAPLLFDDVLFPQMATGDVQRSDARLLAHLPHVRRDWTRLETFRRAESDALTVIVRSGERFFACWAAKHDSTHLTLLVADARKQQRAGWQRGVDALLTFLCE